MDHIKLFNIRGGDGGTLELPEKLFPKTTGSGRKTRRQTFYHQRINFRLPDGSSVTLIVVITTRRKWELKMHDKTGWTVIPFLKNWVVVLQLMA